MSGCIGIRRPPRLPFEARFSSAIATVISVSDGWAVADCGLKALGMDHGNPTMEDGDVWFCSDEHITFAPAQPVSVGDNDLACFSVAAHVWRH